MAAWFFCFLCSTYSYGATIVADLAGDYAAGIGSFSEGQDAVLTGTNGTWTFKNVGQANGSLIYYGAGNKNSVNFKGFAGPRTDWSLNVPAVSSGVIFDDDNKNANPVHRTDIGSVNIHPSNSTDDLVLSWDSNYSGPVRITGFVQHAKTNGTGLVWSGDVSNSSTGKTVDLGSGTLKSSAADFSTDTMIISTNTSLNIKSHANGSMASGLGHAGVQIEAVPYITSIRDSFGENGTLGVGWSYYVSDNANIDGTTNEIKMTYNAIGANGAKPMFTDGNGSGITPNKVYGDSVATDSTELEFHPANHNTGMNYVLARWEVGAEDGTWFDIAGSLRQLNTQYNGIEFSILADGDEIYNIVSDVENGNSIPYEEFFLEQVFAKYSIDFVINSLGKYNGDSTLLSAYIMAGITPETPDSVPEPATWAMMVLGAVGIVFLKKKGNRQ
ncbi:MAG: PEP-CTERM sorting domain-containing protein [Planctomycetia bacterium]|nr:PEP-CTERM sorting domain-containing protein [Planctomycetia bacterium]